MLYRKLYPEMASPEKLEGVLATPIPSRKVIITEKCKAVLMNIMHEAVPFKGLQQW